VLVRSAVIAGRIKRWCVRRTSDQISTQARRKFLYNTHLNLPERQASGGGGGGEEIIRIVLLA